MIDLHLHTTASDGKCSPRDLVERAHTAGIHTIAVTDHDTVAGLPEAAEAARELGVTLVPGIEITSVHGGKDVHVLAYFMRDLSEELRDLLLTQRRNRTDRAQQIAERLAAVGAPIDVPALMEAATALGGKSLARPQIAAALIAAGHVTSIAEAFERFLAEDGPAYVPHRGASPVEVVDLILRAGGVASLAHPGYTRKDEIIPELVAAGLTAIEAYHSSHDQPTTARYLALGRQYGLCITGGSDFHGEGTRRSEFFGVTHLPVSDYRILVERREESRHVAAQRLAMAWGM